jgi:hypothetical protein
MTIRLSVSIGKEGQRVVTLLDDSITTPLPCSVPTHSAYDSLTTKQRAIHLMHLRASIANVDLSRPAVCRCEVEDEVLCRT